MGDAAAIRPASQPTSAAAARSVCAGSAMFPPNPTYARVTRSSGFSKSPLNDSLTFADVQIRVRVIRVGRIPLPALIKDGAMSTLMELTVVLVLCPAALAIWADARYPNLRPREIRRTTVHLGIGGVLAFLGMRPILAAIAAELSGPTGKATAILAACAVITYCLTVSVWIVRLASETVREGR